MSSPATVQRYAYFPEHVMPRIQGCPDGEWVKWEDHCRALEAAQKEVAELRAKVGEVEQQNKTLRAAFATADDQMEHSNAMLVKVEAERDEARGLLKAARPFIAVEDNAEAYDVRDRIDALLGSASRPPTHDWQVIESTVGSVLMQCRKCNARTNNAALAEMHPCTA